tara:strand:+ start:557 stop:1144 length:588 start_codon:yes stop_codon:yes gene_type:complete
MSEITYSFAISLYFSNGVDTTKLKSEINNSNFSSNLLRIDTVDDTIFFIFNSILSGSEENTLDNVINSHNLSVSQLFYIPVNINKSIINATNFSRIALYYYTPNKSGNINSIQTSVVLTSNITSIDIKVINIDQATIVFNKNHIKSSNDIMTVEDTNIISNPNDISNLEISIKMNGTNLTKSDFINILSLYIVIT